MLETRRKYLVLWPAFQNDLHLLLPYLPLAPMCVQARYHLEGSGGGRKACLGVLERTNAVMIGTKVGEEGMKDTIFPSIWGRIRARAREKANNSMAQ